jgi:hypothetical protein
VESATFLIHLALLLVSLPLQLGLVAVNGRTRWLTSGEIRFWVVAVFVFVEVAYITVEQWR